MPTGNPSHLDLSSRDSIVATHRSNDLDLPPSTEQNIMALGYPGQENILVKDGIVISYNAEYKGPIFVCELLTPVQMDCRILSRRIYNSFYEDLDIGILERATEDDYNGSGFARGHLAAAGNHSYNIKAYKATYCYSNVLPMFRNVNDIINKMEREGRKLLKKSEKVYICTGPVFDPNRAPRYIKEDSKVRVPDSIFKVIVHMDKDSSKKYLRGYIVKNSPNTMNEDIRHFKKRLPEINYKTGLKILCDVDLREIVDVLHPSDRYPRPRNIGC